MTRKSNRDFNRRMMLETLAYTGSTIASLLLRPSLLTGVLRNADLAASEPVSGKSSSPTKLDTLPMIDTHVHVIGTRLPGVPTSDADDTVRPESNTERLAETVRMEMERSGTAIALCMPRFGDRAPDDPLGINGTLALKGLLPNLHAIGVADPSQNDPDVRKRIESLLEQGVVKGLKCYLGYIHAMPDAEGYAWYFGMARKYKIPVIFHTGDTYSRRAKLKYAHPLAVDEVAADYPEVNFVLAHLGNPWITDAAEVIYKNNQFGEGGNVWADLSALVIGPQLESKSPQEMIESITRQVQHAIRYSERPDRFLYGSDWPLASMTTYRDFIRRVVPPAHHRAVFVDNAKALFRLGET
jgi:predicted TIM-barrel fold metal-dependent hydrolase